MDRLSILLSILTGAMIAGTVVVTGFALGFQSYWVILLAAALSLLVAWPTAYAISRRIKRNDPNWHRKSDPKVLPDPDAPEV